MANYKSGKWKISRDSSNYKLINKWASQNSSEDFVYKSDFVYFNGNEATVLVPVSLENTFEEITFEDFKKHVLNMKTYTIEEIIRHKISVSCETQEEGRKLIKAFGGDESRATLHAPFEIVYVDNTKKYSWQNYPLHITKGYFIEERMSSLLIDFAQVEFIKRIVGYKAPSNLFGGKILKGCLYTWNTNGGGDYLPHEFKNVKELLLPREFVETWEPVYEDKKLPTILSYEGKCDGDTVKYGCREFLKADYLKLNDVLKTFQIRSYKIEAGEVHAADVGRIAAYINYHNEQ